MKANKYKINNILYLSLVLIIKLVIISSQNGRISFYEKSQKEKIDFACKNNKIYCAMSLAIEELFLEMKSIDISEEKAQCNGLCIEYSNVFARDMICDNLEIFSARAEDCIPANEEKESYQIKFNNCTILMEGKISFNNYDSSSVQFGTLLSELKFYSIKFEQKINEDGNLKVSYENSTQKYNYNRNLNIFSFKYLNLTDQMDSIMESLFGNIIDKINELICSNRKLFDTLDHLSKRYSYLPGYDIFIDEKRVTYIYYKNIYYDTYVDIKEKTFLTKMNITFEYALNYDVRCNEGYFVINNFIFDKNHNSDYSNSNIGENKAPFECLGNNSDKIWKTIINDFKGNLDKYKAIID